MFNTHKHKWLKPLFHFFLIFAMLWGVKLYLVRDVKPGPMPMLKRDLSDVRATNRSLYTNKPGLIYFWGTGCQGCDSLVETINDIAATYPVVSVAESVGGVQRIHEYRKKHKLNFMVIPDNTASFKDAYGVDSLPALFVVDKSNHIRFVEKNYVTGAGLFFRLWLADTF